MRKSTLENFSEDQLIALLQEGNLYACELIFRRYYVNLCEFANSLIHNAEEAEEVVQNLFLRLWEKKESISIDVSLKSYLFRAVYNTCMNHFDHLKVQRKYRSYKQEIANNVSSQNPVINDLIYKELSEKAAVAIEKLPDSCRKIFKMSRFDEMAYGEIAETLNISVKTVETQISRALRKLRIELSEYRKKD